VIGMTIHGTSLAIIGGTKDPFTNEEMGVAPAAKEKRGKTVGCVTDQATVAFNHD